MSDAVTRQASDGRVPVAERPVLVGSPGGPLAQVQRSVASVLRASGIGSAEVDARWLVEAVDGRDPLRHPVAEFSGDVARLAELVGRRAARQPLQLVLGTTNFMGHELRCASGVFVPRPETEVLASLAIDAARRVVDGGGRPRVVEVCTGTGAVARALIEAVTPIELVAADLDARAVALARRNIGGVSRRGRRRREGDGVRVVRSDLLEQIEAAWLGTLDVLVANPPYLPAADHPDLEPEVRDHDPYHALVGGSRGDEVVRRLVTDAARWLRPGGRLLVEIDARRADAGTATAAAAGLVEIGIHDDLTGRPRVLVARRDDGTGAGREPSDVLDEKARR